MKKRRLLKSQVCKVPLKPGTYKLYDRSGRLLYVGAAAGKRGLRHRLQAYTEKNNFLTRKENEIKNAAYFFTYTLADSKRRAWTRETRAIRKHKPRGNTYKKTQGKRRQSRK